MRRPFAHYIGLNKMGHHASICLINETRKGPTAEILIKERFTRVKTDDGPVNQLLRRIAPKVDLSSSLICENTFGFRPLKYEMKADRKVPYFEAMKSTGLASFTARFNSDLRFATHHFCHAMAAASISPFRKALIVVLDGSGNVDEAFPDDHPEIVNFPPPAVTRRNRNDPGSISESCTAYLQDGPELECIHKEWQTYLRPRPEIEGVNIPWFSNGLGMFYQTMAFYVFANSFESGKIMGLAPYGKPSPIEDRVGFCMELDWTQSFRGRGKQQWESSPLFSHYANVAASTQAHFEETVLSLLSRLKARHPGYDNLILTGGCALNCVTNMRILRSGLFQQVFVPPFPSDECISFGAASFLRYHVARKPWRPLPMKNQEGSLGPMNSIPLAHRVRKAFAGHKITRPRSITRETARHLAAGKIVGWFQGRSESGPRALGNRSILADPRIKGLKEHLNRNVKFREAFRPYACAVPFGKAELYFEVPDRFESPFMSFAPKVRRAHRKTLGEVAHVDRTSRVQTVRRSQNPCFSALLEEFGKLTGLYCILNTSMNVMGEPIVETVEDAARFFEWSTLDVMAVGDILVERKRGLRIDSTR